MGLILPNSRSEDVLTELGTRFRRLRLTQNLRVADLAVKSGVSARTITRLEAGTSIALDHVVRILRALGRLQALDSFLPPPVVSPIELLKLKGKVRARARRRVDG